MFYFERQVKSDSLEYVRMDHICKTLREAEGNVALAARQLKCGERSIHRWTETHGIEIDHVTRKVTWPYDKRLSLANKVDEHIR